MTYSILTYIVKRVSHKEFRIMGWRSMETLYYKSYDII